MLQKVLEFFLSWEAEVHSGSISTSKWGSCGILDLYKVNIPVRTSKILSTGGYDIVLSLFFPSFSFFYVCVK